MMLFRTPIRRSIIVSTFLVMLITMGWTRRRWLNRFNMSHRRLEDVSKGNLRKAGVDLPNRNLLVS
jgi:hypothetical protein